MKYFNSYEGIDKEIEKQVRYHARRLTNPLKQYMEVEDIEQELMLAILERIKNYDPEKAKLNTFADRTSKQRIKGYCEKLHTQKRCCLIYADSFTQESEIGYDPTPNMYLAIDLNYIEDLLPQRLGSLFSLLKTHSASEISRLSNVPKRTLYDRMKRLRAYLLKYKLHHNVVGECYLDQEKINCKKII